MCSLHACYQCRRSCRVYTAITVTAPILHSWYPQRTKNEKRLERYILMVNIQFGNVSYSTFHTSLSFMLIYCRKKSTTAKLIELQIPHWSEADFVWRFVKHKFHFIMSQINVGSNKSVFYLIYQLFYVLSRFWEIRFKLPGKKRGTLRKCGSKRISPDSI
jgi:hypothetical protein